MTKKDFVVAFLLLTKKKQKLFNLILSMPHCSTGTASNIQSRHCILFVYLFELMDFEGEYFYYSNCTPYYMPAVSCIFMFLQQIKKLKKVNCILFLGGLFLPQFFNFFGFASAFDFF